MYFEHQVCCVGGVLGYLWSSCRGISFREALPGVLGVLPNFASRAQGRDKVRQRVKRVMLSLLFGGLASWNVCLNV